MDAQPLVKRLPVAAEANRLHENRLGSEKRQKLVKAPAYHIFANHDAFYNIEVDVQNSRNCHERLRNNHPAVGAVVEAALKPLLRGSISRIRRGVYHVARE